jgi:hypothetical protein
VLDHPNYDVVIARLVQLMTFTVDPCDYIVNDRRAKRRMPQRQALELRTCRIFAGEATAHRLIPTGALVCALWFVTGWDQGANLAIFTAVAAALFGGLDNAHIAMGDLGRFAALSVLGSLILSQVLLPMADGVVGFLAIMAVVMLPLAAWASTQPMVTLLLALTVGGVNLESVYTPFDINGLLDAGAGTLGGIFIGFFSLLFVRRVGARATMERLNAAARNDLRRLTLRATRADRDAYLERELERVAQLADRRAEQGAEEPDARLFRRLQIGASVAGLRAESTHARPDERIAAERVLTQIRLELDAPRPTQTLLGAIDAALTTAWFARGPVSSNALLQNLVGLRFALFQGAPAWVPTP